MNSTKTRRLDLRLTEDQDAPAGRPNRTRP